MKIKFKASKYLTNVFMIIPSFHYEFRTTYNPKVKDFGIVLSFGFWGTGVALFFTQEND